MSKFEWPVNPIDLMPRCSYCLGPHQTLTKSPMKLCRGCYEYLGRYGRRQVKAVRDQEMAMVRKVRTRTGGQNALPGYQ